MANQADNYRRGRALLLHYLKLADDNWCYYCHKEITELSTFSVINVKPPQNNDDFHDINNISVSHNDCRLAYQRPEHMRRRDAPEGMAWCGRCEQFLPVTNFKKRTARWNGLNNYCRPCELKHRKKWSVNRL